MPIQQRAEIINSVQHVTKTQTKNLGNFSLFYFE